MPAIEPGNSYRFQVLIDGLDLGNFTALEGVGASYDMKAYEEGGENSFVHQLPGRLKYDNIKLSRPVDLESKALGAFFHLLSMGIAAPRLTATVIVFNDNNHPVAEWEFVGVWPVKYTGPSLSADNSKIATETFEFVHTGMIP